VKKIFYEIVIEGPFLMVKGFVFGLLEGSKKTGTVIFSRENNIKIETLSEILKEWLHLQESLTHLIVEEDLLPLITESLRNTFSLLNLKLKERKRIKNASFDFRYEAYAQKYGEEIKSIFRELPPELKISPDYQPKEEMYLECGDGIGSLATCHVYNLKAKGTVEGPIEALLPFYQKIQNYELIKAEPIILHFD